MNIVIQRTVTGDIESKLFSGKAIIVLGPRQVGKTTLIMEVLEKHGDNILILDGDDPTTRKLLNNPNTQQLKQIIGNNRLIFIDEAQRIEGIGLTSKIIIDRFKDVQVIISGSSSFELSQQTHEPLTGRKWTYQLWPISWEEWQEHIGYVKAEQDVENRLVYGLYPDVLNNPNEQERVLRELVDSYLYKDVYTFGNIRKPEVVQKLLQALAYQVGQEVVYKELGDLLKVDPKTIGNYIEILQKAFVIFELPAFSRNLRNEIKSTRKIYFYDNGVRNAVIGQFNSLANRTDIGALWENFLVSERLKQFDYYHIHSRRYFWRTKQQQEVDYVEEHNGQIFGYEFKWNSKRKIRFPKTFTEQYNSKNKGITRDNFREFVIIKSQEG